MMQYPDIWQEREGKAVKYVIVPTSTRFDGDRSLMTAIRCEWREHSAVYYGAETVVTTCRGIRHGGPRMNSAWFVLSAEWSSISVFLLLASSGLSVAIKSSHVVPQTALECSGLRATKSMWSLMLMFGVHLGCHMCVAPSSARLDVNTSSLLSPYFL